jgi:hypothetical protein
MSRKNGMGFLQISNSFTTKTRLHYPKKEGKSQVEASKMTPIRHFGMRDNCALL